MAQKNTSTICNHVKTDSINDSPHIDDSPSSHYRYNSPDSPPIPNSPISSDSHNTLCYN